MKVKFAITITREEGKNCPRDEVVQELWAAIDEIDLWLEDTQYSVEVAEEL